MVNLNCFVAERCLEHCVFSRSITTEKICAVSLSLSKRFETDFQFDLYGFLNLTDRNKPAIH